MRGKIIYYFFLYLFFIVLLGGISYYIYSHRSEIPLPALPLVTAVHVSPQMVLDATNNLRIGSGFSLLTRRDDLCAFGENLLSSLKSQWQTGVFEASTKDFYLKHPGYSNLAMEAANADLDTVEKITVWLNSPGIKKDVTSPDYNSICVVTDGSYTVQILGTYTSQSKKNPIPTLRPAAAADTGPWGISKQLDEHTWTIKVGQDSAMGTPAEIFDALNNYRRRYGSQTLAWDQKLADYAQSRAVYINQIKKTDNHQGFMDFLNNGDGFNKLGFTSLGENMLYGYRLSGVHIIEWVYAGDEPHNTNQLDNKWNYAGVGVSGLGNSIIFGTGRK